MKQKHIQTHTQKQRNIYKYTYTQRKTETPKLTYEQSKEKGESKK